MSQQRDDSTIENAAKREIEKELEVLAKHMQSLLVAEYVKSIKKFVELAQGQTSANLNQATTKMLDQFVTQALGKSSAATGLDTVNPLGGNNLSNQSVSTGFAKLDVDAGSKGMDSKLADEVKEINQEMDNALAYFKEMIDVQKDSLKEIQAIKQKLTEPAGSPAAASASAPASSASSTGGAETGFEFFGPAVAYLTGLDYDKFKTKKDKEEEDKDTDSAREDRETPDPDPDTSPDSDSDRERDRQRTDEDRARPTDNENDRTRTSDNGRPDRSNGPDEDTNDNDRNNRGGGKPRGFKIPKAGAAIAIEAGILAAEYAAQVADQRLQRASRSDADNNAEDVQKAIELARMENNVSNSSNWFDKVTGTIASQAKRADNTLVGNDVNQIADQIKAKGGSKLSIEQGAVEALKQNREMKAKETFDANLSQPFLLNSKGQIKQVRYNAIQTMEEAEQLNSAANKRHGYKESTRTLEAVVRRAELVDKHGEASKEVRDQDIAEAEATIEADKKQLKDRENQRVLVTSEDAKAVVENDIAKFKASIRTQEDKIKETEENFFMNQALDQEKKINKDLNSRVNEHTMERLRLLNEGHREDSSLVAAVDNKISQSNIFFDRQKAAQFGTILKGMEAAGKKDTDIYGLIEQMQLEALANVEQGRYELGKNKNNQILANSSYEMRQENRYLQIETNKKDTKVLNLLALGVREDSKEIADIQQQFYSLTLDSLTRMKKNTEDTIRRLKSEATVDKEAVRQEEVALSEINENITSTNLAMKEDPIQRAKANADYRFKMDMTGLSQKYMLEQQKALLQGHAENSAIVTLLGKQAKQASIESIDKAIQDYKLIQKSYDANHDKYKEFQQQIDALEIQKNSIKLDLKREQLAKSLDTFNLPKDIQPMSYYEALTDKGTHSSYGISMGDTHVSIVVGNVDSDKRVSEVANAVTQAVGGQYRPTISQQLATDSKRIS